GMLAVGVLAFVVSIAFAAGLRLTSSNGPDAATSGQPPTATQPASRLVAEAVPPVVIAPPSPVSDAEPPLLTRGPGHIPGLHNDPTPAPAPPSP
ncbi:MAG: hypothetical protein WAM92_20265, partial [Mycobacterium sp.]